MKNTIKINVSDENESQLIILRGENDLKEVVNHVLEIGIQTTDTLQALLAKTDARIIVSANSSWIEEIQFSVADNILTFRTDDGSDMEFQATLEDFINAINAPSTGTFYYHVALPNFKRVPYQTLRGFNPL